MNPDQAKQASGKQANTPPAAGIAPTSLEFLDDGTPRSALFDDVYHSSDGGPDQARHVFLAGNELPQRWRNRAVFTVLETGFGLGLIEGLTKVFYPEASSIVVFVIMAIVLVIRPAGLFGKEK